MVSAERGRLVVVGASAGGVEALRAMVAGLPADLAASVVVVLHIPRTSPGALPGILDRAGPLPAVAAEHRRVLRPGVVYVAPADHHVLVEDGLLLLSTGPAENGHRPAIDPLFRSAALARGASVTGVVLSGTRDDGAAGLAAVAQNGGTAVVQDPDDALYAAMPRNALRLVPSALVHPAAGIGAALGDLVRSPPPVRASRGSGPVAVGDAVGQGAPLRQEVASAATGLPTTDDIAGARPSPFSCPNCHGVLFELPGDPAPRFRCRVGHAWSPSSLEEDQATAVEDALWTALRALEEKAALVKRLAAEAHSHGHPRSAAEYRARSARTRGQADRVRELLHRELHPPEAADQDAS